VTDRLGRGFVLTLALLTSVAFLYMIRGFLMTLLLAAIFAALAYPLYRRVVRLLGGRKTLASIVLLLLLVLVVVGPVLTLLGVVATEAARIATEAKVRSPEFAAQLEALQVRWQHLPIYERLEPFFGQAVSKTSELLATLGGYLLARAQQATMGTVSFVFSFFIMLYAMFYFFIDGPELLGAIRAYIPLAASDADRVLDRFVSVTRATLKGVLLIATIQGTINGIAFGIIGIDGAVFWAVLMIVLSVIPVIGSAIIWVPTVGYLLIMGDFGRALVLLAFCGLVSGTVDSVLRPRLVGRDTQMHDLLIFCSTLGGLQLFGPVGFIVGPVLAAVFLTVWHIVRTTFQTSVTEIDAVALPPASSAANPEASIAAPNLPAKSTE
jgi:predicted PurR-regulated permease PerM